MLQRKIWKPRRARFESLEARNLLTAAGPVDDSYAVAEDTSLVVQPVAGLLANDTGVKHVALETPPQHGQLILNKNGGFGYRPAADFVGQDTFVYRDAASDATATVTIDVTAGDPGVVATDDAYEVMHGTLLNVNKADEGVLANDTGVKMASLLQKPEHGRVQLHSKGTFNYFPDADFAGTDTFTYIAISSSGASDVGSVTINVLNTAPVAVADAYTTDEDVPLVVDPPNGLLANDSDADGDQLSVHIVDGPLNGYINLSDNGGFEYIAYDPNFNGSDSFTYRAFDGIAYSELATVTLTINPVNDAPVAEDDFYETWDEEELIVGVEEGMLSNDTDVDMDEGDVLTVTLVTTPTRGSVIYDPDGSFAYQPELSTEDYTATFTYNVIDSGGLTDTGTVSILVKAALPVLNDDFYESLEDTVLQGSVANNDRNVDGFAFTTNTLPEYGELIFAADGAFTYLPDEDFVGVDVFTYAVDDGTIEAPVAWVYITVHEDIVTAAIFNDEGFESSTQLAAGDLDKAAVIAQDMNAAIMDAVSQTGIWADGNISVQDLFWLNDYLIDHYTDVDSEGHPIWVDGTGSVVPRQLNTGNDFYYVGQWADWHGDDAGGRLEYGYYGDAVEHGYHLIQNDGGTTTLDGTPGNYTLNSSGGDGTAFWPNVVDGLFHMGFDIVKGENGALEFADNYEEGVDYFFLLNEDGDRNESLADVANWLTYLLGQ